MTWNSVTPGVYDLGSNTLCALVLQEADEKEVDVRYWERLQDGWFSD